jgi:Fe-S-cluster containining protein
MSTEEETPGESRLAEVERQVERGSLFTHTALSTNAARVYETEAMVMGLIDTLVEKGVVGEKEVTDAAASVRDALHVRGESTGPGLVLRVDNDEDKNTFTPVDCAARMHVCHAICCKLHFALSAGEIEGGKVKWDLGQPYHIRQTADGFCVHNDRATGNCGVYSDRPRICRTYSCANDDRIWKDFDNMVLNQEWIDQNLGRAGPRLRATAMIPLRVVTQRMEPSAERPRSTGLVPPSGPDDVS